MSKKKQPQNQDDLTAEIEGQSDRGEPAADQVFHYDSVDMRAGVPRELYREALLCGAAMGLNKSDIVTYALQKLVADPGTQAMKSDFLKRKAEQYGISEYEVYDKVLGVYSSMSRRRRANLPDAE